MTGQSSFGIHPSVRYRTPRTSTLTSMFSVLVWGLVLVAVFDIAILWTALMASANCDRLDEDRSTSPAAASPVADRLTPEGRSRTA